MVTYRKPSRVARSNDSVRKAIENFHYITGNPKVMENLLKSKNVKTLKPYETATGELIPLKGEFNVELSSGESEDYANLDMLLTFGYIPIATKLEAIDYSDIAYYYDLG